MEKKVPMRTCIACRSEKAKRDLIRIVRSGEEIKLDLTGKLNGRGAYVCNELQCVQKLKKQKLLNRAFSMPVSDEIYDKIMEDFLGKQD